MLVGHLMVLLARRIHVLVLMESRPLGRIVSPTMLRFVHVATVVTLLMVLLARPTMPMLALVQMGMQSPDQNALRRRICGSVTVVMWAGPSLVHIARPTHALVLTGMQPQGQVVLLTTLRYVQVAIWVGLSTVLIVRRTRVPA
jgi:hypothetical protein